MISATIYAALSLATLALLLGKETARRPVYCALSAALWPLFWVAVAATGVWIAVEDRKRRGG